MSDLDLLHFEQLKSEVQSQYLKDHSPSFDEISKTLELVEPGAASRISGVYFKNKPTPDYL